MHRTFRSAILVLCAASPLILGGCCKESSADTTAESPTTSKTDESKPTKGGDLKNVDLTPLPLKIEVAKGGMGAMNMTIGDRKSVTVDIGGGASLNIQPLGKGGLKGLKKEFKSDTILHPFKRFAKEDANGFVVEFEADGKTGYVGVRTQEVAGATYVCKTTGLDGVKSVEVAEKNLEACGRLKAK